MKITVIGCTGSMSGPHSPASCYLVQASGIDADKHLKTYSLLLDLGSGSMGKLLQYIDPADLDALLISHCHADHMADLVGMHVYRRWNPQGALPAVLTIGPEQLLSRLNGVDGTDSSENYATEFKFHTTHSGEVLQVGPFTITTFAALHPVEAYGYRIEGPSEFAADTNNSQVALAYTGDTDLNESMAQMAAGVDLLLAEAAFVEDRDTLRGMHLTGKRAGLLAAGKTGSTKRPAAKKLVLTHIQPWTDPEIPLRNAKHVYDGDVELARSGKCWEL